MTVEEIARQRLGVVFEPNDGWDLWDLMHCEQELAALFGRKADLIPSEP